MSAPGHHRRRRHRDTDLTERARAVLAGLDPEERNVVVCAVGCGGEMYWDRRCGARRLRPLLKRRPLSADYSAVEVTPLCCEVGRPVSAAYRELIVAALAGTDHASTDPELVELWMRDANGTLDALSQVQSCVCRGEL